MIPAERGRAVPVEAKNSAQGAMALGLTPVFPGNAVATSAMPPILFMVIAAGQERRARRASRTRSCGTDCSEVLGWPNLSNRHVTGPPKVLDWPKPISSRAVRPARWAHWAGSLTSKRAGGITLRASSTSICRRFRLGYRQDGACPSSSAVLAAASGRRTAPERSRRTRNCPARSRMPPRG